MHITSFDKDRATKQAILLRDMKLYVYVVEAKDLPENARDLYVKIEVGKHKCKTTSKVSRLHSGGNPVWNEEFAFKVHVDKRHAAELVLSVFNHNSQSEVRHGGADSLLGQVRIPILSVSAADGRTLPPTWFSLESPKCGKLNLDCGKILVSLSLHGKANKANQAFHPQPKISIQDPAEEWKGTCVSDQEIRSPKSPLHKADGIHLVKTLANRVERLFSKNDEARKLEDTSDLSSASSSPYDDCSEETPPDHSFEEAMRILEARGDKQDMPEDLKGGVFLDQVFVVPPNVLNAVLFSPGSEFRRKLAELEGIEVTLDGPWEWKKGDNETCLTRTVSYVKAANRFVKAIKAIEEQTYVKANEKEYAVLLNVSTPEVPFGNTFKLQLLYKIMRGTELPSEQETSRLVVSWGLIFLHSTMMKGMIEEGCRRGMGQSFRLLSVTLAENYKLIDSKDLSDKEQTMATLQTEQKSDWKLAVEYFLNLTAVSTMFMLLYVLVHISLCEPSKLQGLEFGGFDLPDSFGELITCGVLVSQLGRVYNMVSHFIQARLRRGCGHGVNSQGDGWVLTVALIEGTNLTSLDSKLLLDPYVVLTCNGKTRSSSVKLQTQDPKWNEILEFDAMEEPPSVLAMEVFSFDGLFDPATSVGHAEINFLKHTSTELADLWVPLEGKIAQSSQSKLHLRIFLDNSKGVETIREYLTKMEKEVGKKLSVKSPHRNSSFQKLFGLPQDEFLISDFTCYLKRKLPLQGRLYLSARIVGFYGNFFGHKTKFFFLWEDVEDIQVLPPSFMSVGSPTLLMILRKGRGLDARHGAKSQDDEGRLKFHFHSFVSFHNASRTIMALWRTRPVSHDRKTAEELDDSDDSFIVPEDSLSYLDNEDIQMTKVYCAELPIHMESIMELFSGGKMEKEIMEKSGCVCYTTTSWEPVASGGFERGVSYQFNGHASVFGDVTSIQKKLAKGKGEGWTVNEVMTLHGVPFGNHFRVRLRYEMEKTGDGGCRCNGYIGMIWFKTCKLQDRMNQRIMEKFTKRLEDLFELVQRDFVVTAAD